jgi:hypothetical protein
MALFTTALGLYGGVLWSGELQGFIIHEMMPSNGAAGYHKAVVYDLPGKRLIHIDDYDTPACSHKTMAVPNVAVGRCYNMAPVLAEVYECTG